MTTSIPTSVEQLLSAAAVGRAPGKLPCATASTTNIVLAGEQTIAGVAAVEGKRVLVAGQTDKRRNGIYDANAGPWVRSADHDSDRDCVLAATCVVLGGANAGTWRMTAPTTGTVTPDLTEQTWERIADATGFPVPLVDAFTDVVLLDRPTTSTYSGQGVIAYELAASGHINGVRKKHLIPAYTATAVYFSPDLNQTGDAFDERYDCEVVFEYANGRASTTTKRIAKPDTVAPEWLYFYVPTTDPDTLVGVATKPVTYTDLTGWSTSFTSGTPKTIVSIRGGKGTNEVRFKLSGAILSTDVWRVVIASSNTFRSLSAVPFAAVELGVRWYTSPADLSGFAWWEAGNYDESSGQWPATFNAGSHVVQQVTAGNRPSDATAKYDGAPALRFDGTDDYLLSTDVTSAYVANNLALLYCVAVPRAIDTNGGLPQQNDGFVSMGGGAGVGLYGANQGTDQWTLVPYNFDGANFDGYDIDTPIQLMTPFLGRFRHQSGNIYVKRDLAAESAAEASGNTDASGMGGGVVVGSATTTTNRMGVDILAWGARATMPASHELAGLETYVMTQDYGGFLRPKLRLPDKLAAIAGDTVRIYWEDVFLHAHQDAVTFSTSGTSGSSTTNRLWSWTPATPGDYTLSVVVSDAVTGLPIAAGTVPITVVASSGAGTARILVIGDSTGVSNGSAYCDRIRSVLAGDGYTVTMLGTKGGRNFTASNSSGLLITATGHGYLANDPVDFHPEPGSTLPTGLTAGVQYYWLANDANSGRVSLTPGGAAVAYTDAGTGSFYVRHTTRERHECRAGWSAAHFARTGNGSTASPFVFYDGATTQSTDGALDFAAYEAANITGGDPTHVVLALSINDFLTGVDADDPATIEDRFATFARDLERMIAAMRAAWPAVKVFVPTIAPPNFNQSTFDTDYPGGIDRWQWRRIQHRVRERTIWQFRNREASGIYLVDQSVISPYPADGDFATSAVHDITQGCQRRGEQGAARIRAAA